MTRRVVVAIAVLATLALGIFLVRADLREYSQPDDTLVSVAPGRSAKLSVTSGEGSPAYGSFTLESVRDVAQLVPAADSFEDTMSRDGGRTVVATMHCDCAVSEDFRRPTFFAIDDEGRQWESTSVDTEEYPDLEGLARESDLGEQQSIRFALVFVVPQDVAGEVDVVIKQLEERSFRLQR